MRVIAPELPAPLTRDQWLGYFVCLFESSTDPEDRDTDDCSILLDIHMAEFLEEDFDDYTVIDLSAEAAAAVALADANAAVAATFAYGSGPAIPLDVPGIPEARSTFEDKVIVDMTEFDDRCVICQDSGAHDIDVRAHHYEWED